MKIYVSKASGIWREGNVKEYKDLDECVETLLNTENFGAWEPRIIISKADDMTKEKCGVECDYEALIYDTYIE